MATKTAFGHPKEQLLDHERTMKWTLPTSGRGLASYPDLRLRCAATAELGDNPEIVNDHGFCGTGFDIEKSRAFGSQPNA